MRRKAVRAILTRLWGDDQGESGSKSADHLRIDADDVASASEIGSH